MLNLKSREGAVVSSIIEGSAAEKAGIEDGDVILSFNRKPIRRSDDLVGMVTATRPGVTVPLQVVRAGTERTLNITVDELDYNAENQSQRREHPVEPPDDHETSRNFGIELQNINAELGRRLQLKETRGALVTDVDSDGPAYAAGLARNDVIIQVGGQSVADKTEAKRELDKIPVGGTVTVRVMRRGENGSRRRFMTMVKE